MSQIVDSGDPMEGTNSANSLGDGNIQQSYAGDWDGGSSQYFLVYSLGVYCQKNKIFYLLPGNLDSFITLNSASISGVINPISNNAFTIVGGVLATAPNAFGLNQYGGYFIWGSSTNYAVITADCILNPSYNNGGPNPYLPTNPFIAGPQYTPYYWGSFQDQTGQTSGPGSLGFDSSTGANVKSNTFIRAGTWQVNINQQSLVQPGGPPYTSLGNCDGTIILAGVTIATMSDAGIDKFVGQSNPFLGQFDTVVAVGGGFLEIDVSSFPNLTYDNIQGGFEMGGVGVTLTYIHA